MSPSFSSPYWQSRNEEALIIRNIIVCCKYMLIDYAEDEQTISACTRTEQPFLTLEGMLKWTSSGKADDFERVEEVTFRTAEILDRGSLGKSVVV